MPLFEVAIIQKPTKKELDEGRSIGKVDINWPEAVMARDAQSAAISAVTVSNAPTWLDMHPCGGAGTPFWGTRMTQCDQVLAYLKAGHTLTAISAFRLFYITALAERCRDLREKGYAVRSEIIRLPSAALCEVFAVSYKPTPHICRFCSRSLWLNRSRKQPRLFCSTRCSALARHNPPGADPFWNKVRKPKGRGCWIWKGAVAGRYVCLSFL